MADKLRPGDKVLIWADVENDGLFLVGDDIIDPMKVKVETVYESFEVGDKVWVKGGGSVRYTVIGVYNGPRYDFCYAWLKADNYPPTCKSFDQIFRCYV